MLPPVLISLFFFTLTAPLVGWAAERIGAGRIRDIYPALGLAITSYFLYTLFLEVQAKGPLIFPLPLLPIEAGLQIDMLGVFMALAFIMLGIFSSVYSVRYMERDAGLTEYYTLLLGMVTGMVGVAFAGDFFTFYIFWKLMSITSYILVAFRRGRWPAIEAGFKYLVMSAFGSTALLLAMAFLYGMAGTLNFAHLSSIIRADAPGPWLVITLALLVIGFGIKAAVVPLHTWLPDAHPEAPSSISALLSGVLMQTGLYGLSRVLFLLFSPDVFSAPMVVLAVLTMTVGNFMALLQDDIKRLLAYSSIAHMGYMLIGVAAGTRIGLTGTFFHIFNHALMKGLAFLTAGSLWHATGTRSLKELRGAGRAMPVTMVALAISFFGLLGVPGTNGFFSKWIVLFGSAFEAGMAWLGVIGILNSVFSVGYYMLAMRALLTRPAERPEIREAPLWMIAPMGAMAFLIVFFGIWPGPLLDLADQASGALIDYQAYVRAVVG